MIVHRKIALALLALAFSACAQERPPQILEVYREFWKPANVPASREIEVEASQICVELKCPHPYLGLESLKGPKEAWFLNGFDSSTEQAQVAEDYQENPALIEALNQILIRKRPLSRADDLNVFTQYEPRLSREAPWSLGQGRFLVITVTKRHLAAERNRVIDGTVFETADGTRFIFRAARTQREADARAAGAGPETRVFAVRPYWSLPAQDWVAMDPSFWKGRPIARADSAAAPFIADGLGKGTTALDGPWQFHLGDNGSWASADVDDATGQNGWEQLSAAKPWGEQGHKGYAGFAWYRRRVSISLAPGASAYVALYVPPINDAYQVYWNGVLVGQHGKMPPHPIWYYLPVPETMGLGQARSGVLAVRVWRAELTSSDSDAQGGFVAAPSIGSPTAIGALKTASDYRWLSRNESLIILDGLYFLVGSIALLAWLRDRRQVLLFWMAACDITVVAVQLLQLYRFPIPYVISVEMAQPLFGLASVSTWYLLALLLGLDESRIIWRGLRLLAIVAMSVCVLDTIATYAIGVVSGKWIAWMQEADWILSAIYNVEQLLPTPLVICAVVRTKRLSAERWVVAIFFLLCNLVPVFESVFAQGSRFAPLQWILHLLLRPLFTINGAVIDAQALTAALLLFAIVFAVYRISREEHRRKIAVEQEFESARELRRVLVPEKQPLTPGYALTSSYKPASQVGGDFFQVVALENDSTLIVLGDVSGKGLKAAMAVSLIVGMVRALACIFPEPCRLLAEINDRLAGRLHGAFATAIALLLDPQGTCTLASAGHLSPFVNDRELWLPGALPLGIVSGLTYEDNRIQLQEGDYLALYTDGLLEARSATGELYGFERMQMLFTSRPNAGQASEAAVTFGQDDDITVLTLTRLGVGDSPVAQYSAPMLSTA